MFLRILAAALLGLWFLLVLLGKGKFVHILLLVGLAVVVIEIVIIYRRQMTE